jgi:hypothetical protein
VKYYRNYTEGNSRKNNCMEKIKMAYQGIVEDDGTKI